MSTEPSPRSALSPRFVIVIPTKNRRALLQRALESIRSQNATNYRIVIIDDGSTDGTADFIAGLSDPAIQTIRHEKSKGVNAARNAAYRTLTEGEWALPLDDDDCLLPHALETITHAIQNSPGDIQIFSFNTITAFAAHEKETGRIFSLGQEWYEPSYYEFFVDPNIDGDLRSVYKWNLFPTHLFQEDINGFEGEWLLGIAREGIRNRTFPQRTVWIDATHTGEHLSDIAARRDPASFVRAHLRIFKAHAPFFTKHPEVAAPRALSALKLSVRAFQPINALRFLVYYLYGKLRLLFGKRKENKEQS